MISRAGYLGVVGVLLTALAHAALARQDPDQAATAFLRFVPAAGEFAGELQTSLVTYQDDQGRAVELVAAVHVADRAYYEALNDYFTGRDAVLYELVADEDLRPDGRGAGGGSGLIGFLQTSMTRVLGLAYQLDVINYARPNFIHADLEPQELSAVMEAKGETLFSAFLALVLSEVENQRQGTAPGGAVTEQLSLTEILRIFALPNRQDAFKYLLGQGLAQSESSLAAINGAGFTLLDDRNGAALDALRETLNDPSAATISIFYGAAHMPGLEQGLLALGFSRISQRWLTAWRSGPQSIE
jgi:hypothetical protein